MTKLYGLFLTFLVAVCAMPAQTPSGRDVVSPSTYTSIDPVTRGANFQLAVVLKIRNGFHVNAREASEDYLIPTELRVEAPSGFKAGAVSYPKGELHTFAFSKKPLNVYQDNVILRVPVTTSANAPLGTQHIPLKVRYQACSQEICLPPVTLDMDAAVNIAASAKASRPAHSELFPKQ
jgi:DsbC/DsbD-like thiol-disulfide interchange protein